MKKFIYMFVLLFTVLIFAQNKIRVEQFVINGTLKQDDPISAGLGRINAVKLNFTKGDGFYSKLTADFLPLLVLVPPSGKYKIMYPNEKTYAASFDGTINETGQWLLYIVGDSSDTGNYKLSNKYASAIALNFKRADNFCEKMNLLLEHEKAHFHFLKGKEIDDSGIWESKINFNNDVSSEIYGNADEWFKSVLIQTSNIKTITNKFTHLVKKIEKCIGKNWSKKVNDWHNVFGKNDTKEKIVLFSEQGNTANRYIKVIFSENKLSNSKRKYALSLIISELK